MLALVLVCLSLTLNLCAAKEFRTFENVGEIPKAWVYLGHSPPSEVVTASIALFPRNMDKLTEELLLMSDLSSPRYGHHWSKEEVDSFVAPPASDVDLVSGWAKYYQVEAVHHGSYFRVKGDVKDIEAMLQTKFLSFQHKESLRIIDRVLMYNVPDHLSHIVRMVSGITAFPLPKLGNHKRLIDPKQDDTQVWISLYTHSFSFTISF